MGITVETPDPPSPPGSGSSGSSGGGKSSGSSGSSGSSSSGSSKSSGGSSGGTGSLRQKYVELYRVIFGANVKPTSSIIDKAVSGRWSSSYFRLQIRLTDKNYFKSSEAKQRAADFRDVWQTMFSGAKMNKTMLRKYLRSDMNKAMVQDFLLGSKIGKRHYKDFGTFRTAQATQGVTATPALYKRYQDAFRDAYSLYGIEPPKGYEKLFFRSGLTDQEFQTNFRTAYQAAPAFQWAEGRNLAQGEQKKVLFNQKGAAAIRGRLQSALARQHGFFGGNTVGFDAQRDQTTGLVKQSI